jgi:hypothetical protein
VVVVVVVVGVVAVVVVVVVAVVLPKTTNPLRSHAPSTVEVRTNALVIPHHIVACSFLQDPMGNVEPTDEHSPHQGLPRRQWCTPA